MESSPKHDVNVLMMRLNSEGGNSVWLDSTAAPTPVVEDGHKMVTAFFDAYGTSTRRSSSEEVSKMYR